MGDTPHCSFAFFENGAVSCDSAIAACAGKEILSQGGSAIDAAIATMLVNGMSNPHSMGLGGGFFMIYFDASSHMSYAVDAREIAPFSGMSGSSIALPVEILGYKDVHRRWGRLPWKDLFQPAIKCAKEGMIVTAALARAIRLCYGGLCSELQKLLTNNVSGEPFCEGDLMKWPTLGQSLELLSNDCFEKFLDNACNDLKDADCQIDRSDFDKYQVLIKQPLAFEVPERLGDKETFTVVSQPPPSGGCIVSLILNLLSGVETYGRNDNVDDVEENTRFYHRFVECAKLAYPAFEFVGDPTFHSEVPEAICQMLDPALGKACSSVIGDDVLPVSFTKACDILANLMNQTSPGHDQKSARLGLNVDLGGTAHVCVVAPNGDAVSVTSSINHYFGSRIVGPRTGIIWNNTLEDFAYKDRERFRLAVATVPVRHYVEPGKRPVSAMSPVIVISSPKTSKKEEKQKRNLISDKIGLQFPAGTNAYLMCGGAGGSRIVGAVSYVLSQALLAPRPILLSKAIAAPRIRHWIHNSGSSILVLEAGFCSEVKRRLEQRGHLIEEETERFLTVISGIQFVGKIEQTPKPLLACCDGRKGGCPAGF